MTKKFDKAKAESIRKYDRLLGYIKAAMREEADPCRICQGWETCDKCPVRKYCRGEPRNAIRMSIWELNLKIIERLSLLEKLEG